jgi:small subunit ribosomal protein S19
MAEAPKVPRGAPRRARKKKATIEGRRTKEFLWRGRAIADLQALPSEEIVQLLPARARRFLTRLDGHEDAKKLMAKVDEANEGDTIRTHLRDFPILPKMVGRVMAVHNGKEFKDVTITSEMIGHKLGEFAPTRGSVSHTGPGVGATRSSKFMPLK